MQDSSATSMCNTYVQHVQHPIRKSSSRWNGPIWACRIAGRCTYVCNNSKPLMPGDVAHICCAYPLHTVLHIDSQIHILRPQHRPKNSVDIVFSIWTVRVQIFTHSLDADLWSMLSGNLKKHRERLKQAVHTISVIQDS